MKQLYAVPDARIRRARQGHWEPYHPTTEDGEELSYHDHCKDCGAVKTLNVLKQCKECCFMEKIGTIAIVAEPWALREVRRLHGENGVSHIGDQNRKANREAALADGVELA